MLINSDADIRKAGSDDMELIASLAHNIWPQTYRDILSAEQIAYMLATMYDTALLRKQVREMQHQFLVAYVEGEAAGFASYSRVQQTGIFKLHKLYVHPTVQSKGIGRSLLDFIVEEIKVSTTALELNVNRNNKAVSFYKKLGFRVVREEDIDIGNGYYMNDYVMRKELDDRYLLLNNI